MTLSIAEQARRYLLSMKGAWCSTESIRAGIGYQRRVNIDPPLDYYLYLVPDVEVSQAPAGSFPTQTQRLWRIAVSSKGEINMEKQVITLQIPLSSPESRELRVDCALADGHICSECGTQFTTVAAYKALGAELAQFMWRYCPATFTKAVRTELAKLLAPEG